MSGHEAKSEEWQDTPEKAAWRDLIPAAADAISGFSTADGTIGDLAPLLAARVLNVAFQRRDGLRDERLNALVEHICWERFDCSREWAECDHGIARRLVEHVFPPEATS